MTIHPEASMTDELIELCHHTFARRASQPSSSGIFSAASPYRSAVQDEEDVLQADQDEAEEGVDDEDDEDDEDEDLEEDDEEGEDLDEDDEEDEELEEEQE